MSRRSERVSEAIRREVSLLIKDELKDPRIGFVTITKATIREGLRPVLVFQGFWGGKKKKKKAGKGLKSALRFIKKEIGHRLKLRYTPEVRLKVDDTLEYAERIEKVLRKIREEKEG
jgi:ribosome-binding factor A